MLDFDTMLIHVGEFGLYQKILFLFQAPFCIFVTFISFGQLFMQIYPTEFWCDDQIGCNRGNLTPGQKQNLSLPFMVSDILCNLNEFDDKYLEIIAYNEKEALKGVCSNVSAPCFYNASGNEWYSEPRRNSYLHVPNTSNSRNQRSPQQYGSRNNYHTSTQNYGQWNNNENYGNTRPVTNANNNPQFGSGSEGNSEYGNAIENYYGNSGRNPNQNGQYGNNVNPTRNPNSYENNGYKPNNGDRYETNTEGNPNGNSGQNGNRNDNSGNRPNSNGNNGYKPNNGDRYETNTEGNQNGNSGQNGNRNDNRGNRPNSNGNNGYKPNNGDRYETNNEGNQDNNGNSGNSGQNGNRGTTTKRPNSEGTTTNRPGRNEAQRQRRQKSCIERGKTSSFSLSPQTRLLLNSREFHYPTRGKTLDNCKVVDWDEMTPGNAAVYYPTIVTEGNWWCNAELYITISQSVFFVGAIVGGFLIGWIADTYGRVPALVIANVIGAVGGILSTTTTDFYLFSFYRFITGIAFDNCFVMMYILVLEFCGPTYRTIVANLSIAVFYTIGTVLLPPLALWFKDWVVFGRVIAAPMFLALIAYFLVPESSRWLLSKGRTKRATDILRRFAKVNGKKVDEKIFVEFEEDTSKLYELISQEGQDPSLMEAFKTPRLRRTFILLVLIWSSIALVYDGHNRNILNLANAEWNLYWMFGIASLTEFPADILLIVTLDKFGRRWLAFASLSLSGICSFIAATVPRDAWTATFVMAMMSRFWVNVSFNIGLQYASELLPTVIRAQGVNIIHIMGYVATLVSPLIAQIGRSQPVLSLLLLGAVALGGGILSLFLSETLGEDLPNNLEEAEAFGKHQSFWNCPICAKPKPVEEEKVVEVPEAVKLRNSLRASSRGETYRSSIISNPNRVSRFGVALDPFPSEKSRLKRGYTR